MTETWSPTVPDWNLTDAAKAANDGRIDVLRGMIAMRPSILDSRDADGRTLLDLACRAATGDIAIPFVPGTPAQYAAIELLLDSDADPSCSDNDGWTPLHTAAMAGHAELAQRLVDAGADPAANAYDTYGGTPLSYALFYAKTYMGDVLAAVDDDEPGLGTDPDNVRSAAALGRDIARFCSNGDLTDAAYDGLEFYAPVFFPRWFRDFSRQEALDEALTWAARNDQCASMAALTELGANVDSNAFRGTPLLWACYADKVEAARWLLDHGADPDLRHDFGGEGHGVDAVALHLAAQHNCTRCVRLLLERGADASIVDGAHGGTPAGWAEHGGANDTLRILRDHAR